MIIRSHKLCVKIEIRHENNDRATSAYKDAGNP